MAIKKVVIIEDDLDIMEVLSLYIENAGFETYKAWTIAAGQALIEEQNPDVIVLDVNLPDGNGFELAKIIREQFDAVIIFLTANDLLEHKLEGFEVGADDYMTKPFIPKELIARIQAHLRRHPKSMNVLVFDELLIHLDEKEVYKNGKLINLYTKEKLLLFYLVEHLNKVVSFDQLIDYVWGFDGIVDTKTLSVHMSTLRRKIEDIPSQPKWIHTVRGFGYKFST